MVVNAIPAGTKRCTAGGVEIGAMIEVGVAGHLLWRHVRGGADGDAGAGGSGAAMGGFAQGPGDEAGTCQDGPPGPTTTYRTHTRCS